MYALHVQLLCRLVSEQQLGVQLERNVVDALLPAVHALCDGEPNLLDQALHVHLLERAADDHVREKGGGREGNDESR